MAILRVRKGAAAGAVLAVHDCKSPTLLGRDRSAHIVVEDDRASRKHARIFRIHGAWILQDLRSRNGTAVDGKPVESARLRSKSVIRIGGTLLSFHPDELLPPPEEEVYGTRLLATLREEGGVFVYRALQSAMDREVRVDRVGARWRLSARVREALEAALADARELEHPGIDGLVHARVGQSENDYVVLRLRSGKPLHESIGSVVGRPLAARIRFLRSLADALLYRSARETLRWPLTLEQVTVVERGGDDMAASIAALELPSIATIHTGGLLHHPSYAPYLAPELTRNGSPAAAISLESIVYGLGAVGYHLSCGQPPMGDAPHRKLLAHHRNLVPAPASLLAPGTPEELSNLLQAMLAKDAAERPCGRTEILAALDRAIEKAEELAPAVADEVEVDEEIPEISVRSPEPSQDLSAEPASPPRPPRRSERVESGRGRAPPPRRRAEAAPAPGRPFLGSVLSLPLWAGLWILLFIGARVLSRLFFSSYS